MLAAQDLCTCCLSPVPALLLQSSHDLLLAFIQDMPKVTSPKRPHPIRISPHAPALSIPRPGFIDRDLDSKRVKTWPVDHSFMLSAQHHAELIAGAQFICIERMESFKWASGGMLGERLRGATAPVSKRCPSQRAELCLADPLLFREGFSEKNSSLNYSR